MFNLISNVFKVPDREPIQQQPPLIIILRYCKANIHQTKTGNPTNRNNPYPTYRKVRQRMSGNTSQPFFDQLANSILKGNEKYVRKSEKIEEPPVCIKLEVWSMIDQ